MKAKTFATIAVVLASSHFLLAATNDLTALVQKGLFEEEANHNLEAAEQAYKTAVENFDNDRQLAATAIFRLGECLRKQGNTNAATVQYQRILREFPDQTQLAKLCREYAGPAALTETAQNPANPADPEAEAIQRIKNMLRDTPDLINGSTGDAPTPLVDAVEHGWTKAVELLLDHGASIEKEDRGRTPLSYAVRADRPAMIELLISRGANVNANARGTTALYDAVQAGLKTPAETLIAHGADVNAADQSGHAPLHQAAVRGFIPMAELLLKHGANVDATDKEGQTPLFYAITKAQIEMAQLLISNKADVNAVDSTGNTPLKKAIEGGEIQLAKLLLDNGAKTELQPFKPLLLAVRLHRNDMIELLLAHHADPNSRNDANDVTGVTPLIGMHLFDDRSGFAGFPGMRPPRPTRTTAEQKQDAGMAEILLNHGADPNLVDSAGKSALHRAVEYDDLELVRVLLAHHCEVNVLDNDGKPPIAYVGTAPGPGFGPQFGSADRTGQQIKALLLGAGANQDYERAPGISIAEAGSGSIGNRVFSKGANSYNQYTLMGLIAEVYGGRSSPAIPFPDLAHVTINRLDGRGKTEDIKVNLDEILKSGDCSRDIALQWADIIQIPQRDHLVQDRWLGLSDETAMELVKCLQRNVEIIVKGKTTALVLRPTIVFRRAIDNGGFTDRNVAAEPGTRYTFDLNAVVHQSNLLLLSSDLSRVKVTRRNPASADHPQVMQFDLTKQPLPDFWLRDGDVIEIPERTPNAAAE